MEGNNEEHHLHADNSSRLVSKIICDMDEEWILNMMVEHHMCPFRGWFENFKEEEGSIMVDQQHVEEILGSGEILLEIYGGSSTMVLKDVKYVPKVSRNYISFLALDREGHTTNFRGTSIKICEGDLVLMEGTLKLGEGVFHGKASRDVQPEVESIPNAALQGPCWNENTIRELLTEDQFQYLLCWEKISALEEEKMAMIMVAAEKQFSMMVWKHALNGFGRQQVNEDFICFSSHGGAEFIGICSCEDGYDHLHLIMIERDGLSYLANILQNYIFDPGGMKAEDSRKVLEELIQA